MARIRTVALTLLLALVVGTGVMSAGVASATTGDIGYQDQSYAGAINVPTSDKPQSKLWFAQGFWWADMFDTVSSTWHIFRLDRSAQQWVDTGVRIDDRADTLADVLWDGTHLYVASHVVTISSDASATASQPNSPARLYRFSYSSGRYVLDSGFPAVITTQSSESMTLDKDSTGTLWATWTQVSAAPGGGYTAAVYANATSGGDNRWGTPFVLPVTGSSVDPDDISTVVAFGKSRIGILWSNQLDGTVYWATHADGAARASWTGSSAIRGTKQADDHLNIKAVQADTSGRVFAVVKTSLDTDPASVGTDPQIRLLSFKPGTGAWSATTVSTIADCATRPLLLLDEAHQLVHVFATAPSTSGCAFSGSPGTIYDKTAGMDNPAFATGRGTPVIRDAASPNMNDVTSTKQSVTAASGIVVLASNKATQRYWHADLSVTAPAPTASFTVSATSGAAPLPVQFTDTSSGTPTSWTWDFGDGATATTQNPAHTYAAPGNYTVTLTATNATGASAPVTASVTVSPAPSASMVVPGASTTASATTATTDIALPRPDLVAAGDLLIAQITVDGTPTMPTVPAGWTTVSKTATLGSGAKAYVYSHLVTDPATEPASYLWQMSAAQKWGAGMTAFSGVDPVTPFDTPASAAQDTTYAATALTVPGVTSVTAGALLVGGVGLDNATATVTQPAAWTEAWEATGGQVAELAFRQLGAAGASGDLTWTLSKATAAGGWARVLRPAPHAPKASFTASTANGTAPLPVHFTDTSAFAPTTWAWDFGDGATAIEQNPTHTYAAPGTYTVTMTATNGVGTSAPATSTVTVTQAPPVASFTTSANTGVVPVTVQFTDTSAGSPTAWAWDFGDGTTATEQNPAHTYTAVGTYTVRLTATNGGGASSPATATVTVTPPPPVVGSSTTASGSNSVLTLARPSGIKAGDIIVVRLATDKNANVRMVPSGWTAAPGNTATVAVYYHVVSNPAAEPLSYTWRLAATRKWTGIMTPVSNVDPTTPLVAVSVAKKSWPAV